MELVLNIVSTAVQVVIAYVAVAALVSMNKASDQRRQQLEENRTMMAALAQQTQALQELLQPQRSQPS